jgi:LruC domain-containing protein/uncharacterized repeat protein (TIGR01451 family)
MSNIMIESQSSDCDGIAVQTRYTQPKARRIQRPIVNITVWRCMLVLLFSVWLSAELCAGVDWSGQDLSDAKLNQADLRGANLSGANLSNAKLNQADLSGANLSGANLSDASLSGADLTGVRSGGVTGIPKLLPTGWQLLDGYLVGPGMDFSDADLSGVDLSGVDLAGADLSGADLSDADLTEVRSGGITGTPAALPTGWKFAAGYLIGPGLDLSTSDLSGVDLSGVDLSNAKLNHADLSGVNFSGANLSGAKLNQANLSDANLSDANLSHAKLNKANLRCANLSGTDLSNAKLNQADLSCAHLNDVDLSGADLTGVIGYQSDAALVATTQALQSDYRGIPLSAGDSIQYTVTIHSTGSDAATSIDIQGLIPAHTEFVAGSLSIDGVPSTETLAEGVTLSLSSLAAGASVVLQFEVTVAADLPAEAVWIESAVVMDYAESSTAEVSDNDPSGHCGIVDNGVDHLLDEGSDTGDDDPSLLPLLQACVYESCILAFEDLQNAGWCDWDMNDIVLDIHSYYVVNQSDEIESMVVSYQLLARGAGYESRMNLTLPFSGDAQWQRIYLDQAGEMEANTLGSATDSATVVLWESSKDALPPYTGLKYQWGAARTERFDPSAAGKLAVVNVYFDSAASNPLATFEECPYDTWAWIPNTQQAIHRLMYNLASSQTVYSGPLYGRSLPFVAKFDSDFVWPHEGHAIWLSHPEYVDFIKFGTNLDWHHNFNIWRVWHDDAGKMNGREDANPVATHSIYSNYVETWSQAE